MKDRHLYTVIAAAFLILGITNIVTVYLYAKEKIQHHKTEKAARQLSDKVQSDAANLDDYRKQAQKKFLDTVSVLNIAKKEQEQLRQQLISSMTQRGKHIQALHSTRAPNINDAFKIIQEDGTVFSLYNQYLQIADGREKTFIERAQPLGAVLGVGGKSGEKR